MLRHRRWQFLTSAALCGSLAGAIAPDSGRAAPNTRFQCVVDGGIPTTTAFDMTHNRQLPVIRWESTHFAGSGYDAIARCQQVSKRFQSAFDRGDLNFLTAGEVNNLPVICATSNRTSGCTNENVLFTLEPGQSARDTLRQLFEIRHYAARPLTRGIRPEPEGQERIYIDFQSVLADNGEATATPEETN